MYTSLTYLWVVCLSSWGGVAKYIRKIREGHSKFSLAELIGEICISAFVGVLTFFLCESAQLPAALSAALIGISGHMGSQAIYLFEGLLVKFANRFTSK